MRGVSAAKEDVHNAIKNIDKGIFPQATLSIVTSCTPMVQVPSLAWLTCIGRKLATSPSGRESLRMPW